MIDNVALAEMAKITGPYLAILLAFASGFIVGYWMGRR